MKLILKVIALFIIVLGGFVLVGLYFYSKSENMVTFLIFSHVGLILAIFLANKFIKKKAIPHKSTDVLG